MISTLFVVAVTFGLVDVTQGQISVQVNNTDNVKLLVHEEHVTWMLAMAECEDNTSYGYPWTDELHYQHLSASVAATLKLPSLELLWFGALRPLGVDPWFSAASCSEMTLGIDDNGTDTDLDMCAVMNVSQPTFNLLAWPCNESLPFVCVNETLAAPGPCEMVSFPDKEVDTTSASGVGLLVVTSVDTRAVCENNCLSNSDCMAVTTTTSFSCVTILYPPSVTSESVSLQDATVQGTTVSGIRTCNNIQFIPTGTVNTSAAIPALSCPATNLCYCYNGLPLSDDNVNMLADLFGTLVLIDPEDTSVYRRKRATADDSRPSAKTVGSFAIIFIMSVFILISLPDIIILAKFCYKKYTQYVNRTQSLENLNSGQTDAQEQSGETPPTDTNNADQSATGTPNTNDLNTVQS